MSSHEDIEERLRQLGRAVGTDDSFSKAVMARIRKEPAGPDSWNHKSSIQLMLWRFIMNKSMRWAVAAAIILAVVLAVGSWDKLGSSAYAISQTVEALQNCPIHARRKARQSRQS